METEAGGREGQFHLGDILSITTEYLVAPSGIGGVYKILNYMTGDSLFTHQLPRAGRECKPWLERQFPHLSEAALAAEIAALTSGMDEVIEASDRKAVVERWLAVLVLQHGEFHEVRPIPREEHERRDPLAELEEMVGPERVIVLDVGRGEGL